MQDMEGKAALVAGGGPGVAQAQAKVFAEGAATTKLIADIRPPPSRPVRAEPEPATT